MSKNKKCMKAIKGFYKNIKFDKTKSFYDTKHYVLNEFIQELKEFFPEYSFEKNMQGAGWARIFVKYNGVTLGRINFEPDNSKEFVFKLYGTKHYKPYEYNYKNIDDFFLTFYLWFKRGIRLGFDDLVSVAKKQCKEKVDGIKKWRKENPKYDRNGNLITRPKIRTSWMNVFRKLVRERMKEMDYVMMDGDKQNDQL